MRIFSRNIIKIFITSQIKNNTNTTKPKVNWHPYVSFFTGSLLAISETMPFIDSESNGILHAIKKIQENFTQNFK